MTRKIHVLRLRVCDAIGAKAVPNGPATILDFYSAAARPDVARVPASHSQGNLPAPRGPFDADIGRRLMLGDPASALRTGAALLPPPPPIVPRALPAEGIVHPPSNKMVAARRPDPAATAAGRRASEEGARAREAGNEKLRRLAGKVETEDCTCTK